MRWNARLRKEIQYRKRRRFRVNLRVRRARIAMGSGNSAVAGMGVRFL
jgi:hypothetical protein